MKKATYLVVIMWLIVLSFVIPATASPMDNLSTLEKESDSKELSEFYQSMVSFCVFGSLQVVVFFGF